MRKKISEPRSPLSPLERVAATIRAHRLRKGWDSSELARRANVSRTTLHHLERAATPTPRAATLRRIAEALEIPWDWLNRESDLRVPSREIPNDSPPRDRRMREEPTPESASASTTDEFDRTTNPVVTEIAAESPEVFRDWSAAEWCELYSSFGIGGALTRAGVIATAQRIVHRREIMRKLEIVLDTHLDDVAGEIIDALYRLVDPKAM